jgi:hypothetical protein
MVSSMFRLDAVFTSPFFATRFQISLMRLILQTPVFPLARDREVQYRLKRSRCSIIPG